MSGSTDCPRPAVILRLAAVALFSVCTGCRTPLPKAVERTREITAARESRVVAVRDATRLALRFRIKGRDAYATAALPPGKSEAQSVMEFGGAARNDFSTLRRTGKALQVYGPEAWRVLSRSAAEALAPASPREGVLVTTGGLELIVCREASGSAVFLPLTNRPRGMKIVRRLTAAQLVPRLTEAFAARHGSTPGIVLTGSSPPLMFFEPALPRLTFIFGPPEETLRLPVLGASPDVTVRGVISLGIRSGVIATVKNPVTTLLNGSANLISMADAALHHLLSRIPSTPPPPVVVRAPMDNGAWEARLDRITGEPRVPASVRFRIDGEQFFPDFIHAIQEARESIDIQLYIFDTDDYALQIADVLKAKSKEVPVRIMIDEAASLQSSLLDPAFPNAPGHIAPSSIVDYLRRDSNIRVRPMGMPALSATHTKMILIDGRRAWLGGMNIGREYRSDWHDMMIEVRGPLIGWMQRSFAHSWAHNGWTGDLGELSSRLRSSRKAGARIPVPENAIMVRPLRGSAIHSDIKSAQFAALRSAQQCIWLENAYITDSRYIAGLIAARRRGVDVRIIVPAENDSPLMKANNRALIPQLLRHGIRVWELPEMSHVKAALYDGWACTGSANYDRISFRVNQEFNIGFSDPATVAALRRDLFLRDMARGREVKTPPPASAGSQITDSLLQMLAGQL
jgi:cardiolipin synthase